MGTGHSRNGFSIEITKTENPLIQRYPIATNEPFFYKMRPFFSFKYYDDKHNIFSIESLNKHDMKLLFNALKKMSNHTWKQIFDDLKDHYHAHQIKWDKTDFPNGLSHLPVELKDMPAWQFKTFSECRVVGFFNEYNVFKICWIDRHHKVYPRD
jgi:hypothetical protein